jgi:hypothetical protein
MDYRDFRKKKPGPSIWDQAGRDKSSEKMPEVFKEDVDLEKEKEKAERFKRLKGIIKPS